MSANVLAALGEAIAVAQAEANRAQLRVLEFLSEVPAEADWECEGAHDDVHWTAMLLGVAYWRAERYLVAARKLDQLPKTRAAFARGDLSLDKLVELTRFATPETEAELVDWARTVSPGRIRHRGNVLARQQREEAERTDRARSLSWWFSEDGRRFELEASLPAAEGSVVARALERLAADVPAMPGEEDRHFHDARLADALFALASQAVAADPDADRATVVVHAELGALRSADRGFEVEGGGVVPADAARRLLCSGRVQAVVEDGAGVPIGLGRLTRVPPAWMLRQLRYRDGECRFPGCGSRRWTQAHHVVWWGEGGETDLENLVLLCTFHHKLVHEYGWSVLRRDDGSVEWKRSDGTPYRAGPGPPGEPALEKSRSLLAVAGL